jgi:cell division protein FtsQ
LSRAETGRRHDGAVTDVAPRRNLWRGLFAALLTGLMTGGGYLLLQWEPHYLPVRVVKVNGTLRHLSRERLVQTVVGHLRGGILTQDLTVLKRAVEAMPWVRSVSLRRVWPDRLELDVSERRPLARWGDHGLVTAQGLVFRPKEEAQPPGLPLLAGTDAQAPLVVARFETWRRRLAAVGLNLDALTCDERGAWAMAFAAGLEVRLGVSEVQQRFERFLYAYPYLTAAGRAAAIDVRYSNGLAVRWADPDAERGGRSARSAQALGFLPRPAARGPGRSRS